MGLFLASRRKSWKYKVYKRNEDLKICCRIGHVPYNETRSKSNAKKVNLIFAQIIHSTSWIDYLHIYSTSQKSNFHTLLKCSIFLLLFFGAWECLLLKLEINLVSNWRYIWMVVVDIRVSLRRGEKNKGVGRWAVSKRICEFRLELLRKSLDEWKDEERGNCKILWLKIQGKKCFSIYLLWEYQNYSRAPFLQVKHTINLFSRSQLLPLP